MLSVKSPSLILGVKSQARANFSILQEASFQCGLNPPRNAQRFPHVKEFWRSTCLSLYSLNPTDGLFFVFRVSTKVWGHSILVALREDSQAVVFEVLVAVSPELDAFHLSI